ncbi:hypothetical protein [Stenotrophomonas sp.]|uniref:hypothetical protein n=1 Tax=Stenotrophomonas sp. TaxID=69392 RepID=UPI0028A5ADDE|nr:hypothetical protein [Stenotrophomonas sp.]
MLWFALEMPLQSLRRLFNKGPDVLEPPASDRAPLKQTSPSSEEGSFDASAIGQLDWWQGSVVESEKFGMANSFGHPFFVVASQTCNLRNPDLSKAPLVELIAARPLDSVGLGAAFREGAHPRTLHSFAHSENDGSVGLELSIEQRVWVPRELLASIPPCGYRIVDDESNPAMQYKEIFSSWLARSYTRVELPDEFNELLQGTGLLKQIKKWLVDKFGDEIQGIYFSIAESADDEEAKQKYFSPTAISNLKPPYDLEITVVVHDVDKLAAIEGALEKFDEPTVPDPSNADRKISRIQIAEKSGLAVNFLALGTDGWSLQDMIESVKYTQWDFLSSLSENVQP